MIDIIIVEDNYDVMQSLKYILESDGEINIIGMADNGPEAVELADRLAPNLMLMDIKLPGLNGLEAAKRIKENYAAQNRNIKILILSTFYDDDYVAKSQEYGVDGYLLKGVEIGKLASAIKNTYNGFVTLDRVIYEKQSKGAYGYPTARRDYLPRVDANYTPAKKSGQSADYANGAISAMDPVEMAVLRSLTDTEYMILKSIVRGKSNADIAGELYLSKGTVKNYISKMLLKLDCKNSRDLAAFGSRAGL